MAVANTRRRLSTVPGERVREIDARMALITARQGAEKELFRRLGDQAVRRGVNPYDAIQSCLDEAFHELRFFSQEIEALTPQQLAWQTGHRKILQLVHRLRREVYDVSQTMIKLGLDERVAAVKEAQLQMIVRALDKAMEEAGISADQRVAIGRQLKALEPARLEE